ncbi:DUF3122 domain-containing protein [Geminocystis herdmanii]|uniref:DUF3122 domain-containing protein n=1 Tax=Geminocystis herdmanii TaxID=669359 RepID=UPI00034BD46D|nr:DUF3122 domain-containing protein [Geminocystis herdmanii]
MLALIVNFSISDEGFANIIKQTEGQEQVLYQARHRLVDNQGNSWQTILFKRVKEGKIIDLNLRLVGFPDVVKFNHPQDLIVTTLNDEDMKARDEFAEKPPAENVGQVGQYDFKNILPVSIEQKYLTLLLPVQEKSLTLKIPYPVLLEWQEIATNNS